MKPPGFWYPASGTVPWPARALTPLGWLYDLGGQIRRWRTEPFDPGIPVLCVGNLTAGGTGKTPLAISLSKTLKAKGWSPAFLTRGYGGSLEGPVEVDAEHHRAEDVGDEPLLLARAGLTIVSRNRIEGAQFAKELGADLILMDDGFQNPSLKKSLSLLVVDGEVVFGNGQVIPAGPLRETVGSGVARADAVIVMGGTDTAKAEAALQGFRGPLFHARLQHDPEAIDPLKAERFVAFAGIGRPEKFFASARGSGLNLAATRSFPDHHPFSEEEIEDLKSEAKREGASLLTTEKDAARMGAQMRALVKTLPVTAQLVENDAFTDWLTRHLGRGGADGGASTE